MKKTVLLSLLSVTAFSVTSNAMASNVSSLLKQAFPQSMFRSKCSSKNAKIDWGKVATIEQLGGINAIQKKLNERVIPCLKKEDEESYHEKFKKNCMNYRNVNASTKNQVCGGDSAQLQQQAQDNPFGMPQEEQGNPWGSRQQPQGGFGAQQQAVMSTPVQGKGNTQALEGQIQELQQQVQLLVQYMQQLAPFVQQLSAQVAQLESAQQQGGYGQQQFGVQQGGYGQQGWGG